MQKPEDLLGKYMRYSKRIAVFGIAQWALIAGTCLVFIWVMGSIENNVTETLISLATNIITSSSAIAIATSSGYYAHSAYDKKLQKKVEKTIFPDEKEDESSDEEVVEDAGENG